MRLLYTICSVVVYTVVFVDSFLLFSVHTHTYTHTYTHTHIYIYIYIYRYVKCKIYPNTGHEGPEGVHNSELCHPPCVFKLYGEVNSVKNTTINIWINDDYYYKWRNYMFRPIAVVFRF